MGKESACNAGDTGDKSSIPGLGRSPGVAWQPTLGFLPRIPWKEEPGRLQSKGHEESDMTEATGVLACSTQT